MAQDYNLDELDAVFNSGTEQAEFDTSQLDAVFESKEEPRGFFSSVSDPNAASSRGKLLPVAQAAMDLNRDILADPNMPDYIKRISPNIAAGVAVAEEAGEAIVGLGVNLAQNVSNWFSDEPGLLDGIQQARKDVSKTLSPAQQERQKTLETTFRTGAAFLPAAKVGQGAARALGFWANVFQGAKLGAQGAAITTGIDTLLSEDQSVKEQILSPFTGAAFGALTGGTVSAGTQAIGGALRKVFGVGEVKQLGRELADTFRNDPAAKKLYSELSRAGIRPTVADIQPGRTAAKNKLLQAKAMTAAEHDLLDEITTKNQKALAQYFGSTVRNSIDDLAKAGPDDIIAQTTQKAELDKIAGQLRAAAANNFPNVYSKIDDGIPLTQKTVRILRQDKVTDPALKVIQDEFTALTRQGAGAGKALRTEAQAAFNRHGTHYTAKTLDTVAKSFSNEIQKAKITGDTAAIRLYTKANKLVNGLMEDTVPGYGAARDAIGKLSPFPAIRNNPDLQKFFTKMDGDEVYSLLLNPKTTPTQHQQLLNVLANGIKNDAGQLVIPGNKPLLAAVVRDKMNQQFGKIGDLNKNVAQVFQQAFSKNAVERRMWDETFRALGGRSIKDWQSMTRITDAVFDKFGNNMLRDNFSTSLSQMLTGDKLGAAEKMLGYLKRRATFNFMFKKDWQQLLQKVEKADTFRNQVDALFGGLTGKLGNELFAPDQAMIELMENNQQNSEGALDANKKATRNRGF